jgi:hypothetical protein
LAVAVRRNSAVAAVSWRHPDFDSNEFSIRFIDAFSTVWCDEASMMQGFVSSVSAADQHRFTT